jgi:hypothetical protein
MTVDDLDKVLEYFFNKVPERQTALKISKDVFNDDPIIPFYLSGCKHKNKTILFIGNRKEIRERQRQSTEGESIEEFYFRNMG